MPLGSDAVVTVSVGAVIVMLSALVAVPAPESFVSQSRAARVAEFNLQDGGIFLTTRGADPHLITHDYIYEHVALESLCPRSLSKADA